MVKNYSALLLLIFFASCAVGPSGTVQKVVDSGKISLGMSKKIFCSTMLYTSARSDPCYGFSEIHPKTSVEIIANLARDKYFVFAPDISYRGDSGESILRLITSSFSEASSFASDAEVVCPGSYNPNTWHNCVGNHTLPYVDNYTGGEYVGEFKNGEYHGKGTVTAKNNKFVGEFKNGKRHGQGTHTWGNGQKYFGEWKDNKPNGQGTFVWPSGQKYVGKIKEGKYHGQGTLSSGNGSNYVGEFKDDLAHGIGTLTWGYGPNKGDKYVGEWKDDKRNGRGTIIYSDGSQWVGCWQDDKKNGRGKTCSNIPSSGQTQKANNPWSELEESISLNEAGVYVVYAEECADRYWMEKADSETFVKALDGMIKRGISEGRVSKQAVNQAASGAETMIAMGRFTYEQQQLCQMFTFITRQIVQPKDRY